MSSLISASFKPFIMLLKLFGLPINNDCSIFSLSYSGWVLKTYCIFSLAIASLIVGVIAEYETVSEWKAIRTGFCDENYETFARSVLANLTNNLYRQFMLFAVPVIFAIQVYVTRNWKKLWLTLLFIQEDMKLPRKFTQQCKIRCFLALFWLVLVSLSYADIVLYVDVACFKKIEDPFQMCYASISYDLTLYMERSLYEELMKYYNIPTNNPLGIIENKHV